MSYLVNWSNFGETLTRRVTAPTDADAHTHAEELARRLADMGFAVSVEPELS